MEEYREGLRERFANAETCVYWDVEDFPVSDIVSFKENVRLALVTAGYHGKVSITAYGPDEELSHHYKAAGITFVARGSRRARIQCMLLDIHLIAAGDPTLMPPYEPPPTNVMAITKNVVPSSEDDVEASENATLFAHYLSNLDWECYNVLLAVPDNSKPEMIKDYRLKFSLWRWSDLFAGRKLLDYNTLVIPQEPQEPLVCPMCGK